MSNCSVCTTNFSDSETKCPTCGFEKPTVVFTDKEGANKWFEDNVISARERWAARQRAEEEARQKALKDQRQIAKNKSLQKEATPPI